MLYVIVRCTLSTFKLSKYDINVPFVFVCYNKRTWSPLGPDYKNVFTDFAVTHLYKLCNNSCSIQIMSFSFTKILRYTF